MYNVVMTIRKLSFSINEYYHLYSRGVDKRLIFLDNNDRQRFVRLMFLCNGSKPVIYRDSEHLSMNEIDTGEKLVAIGAYCLMPNHFHILIREMTDGGITKFMSKLLTAYSAYFNKRHSRTGALFSSEFKAQHLDSDKYLKYIFSYIHLNPLKLIEPNWRKRKISKRVLISHLSNYYFSSYLDYVNTAREISIILSKETFPQYFIKKGNFEASINDWFNFDLSDT